MKPGGPWNLKGRRPRTHETARDSGQRPGVSVGDWLNSVIERSDDEDEPYGRPHRNHRERTAFGAPQRREGGPYRDSERNGWHGRRADGDRYRDADYGRPERPHEGGRYRDSSRDDRDEREHQPQPDAKPFRKAEHNDQAEPSRGAQREDNSYRDIGYAAAREPRRDDYSYGNAAGDEPHERQREANPAPIAARDAPRDRRDPGDARELEGAARERPREALEETPRRNEFNEVNARLDKLAQQLEHLARVAANPPPPQPVETPRESPDPPLTGGPTPVRKVPREPLNPPLAAAPPPSSTVSSEPPLIAVPSRRRRANAEPAISIDDAVAEIAARQRALDAEPVIADEAPTQAQTPEPALAAASAPSAVLDFGSLEQQLRQITARIEALQPSNEIETAIAAVRSDLAEIGKQLNEALPRRAVESLESEIKALAARIDFSRQAGVDPTALAGLEHGLAEVGEALRGLTPAENLVGADAAVSALAQKVDMILARDDPAMLQQLEAAIGGLRGVVAHVASNDTLNKVAEDVRVLAAQVDAIANNAATAHAVASLEQRIDALAAALQASGDAAQTMPRDSADNAATAHAVASLEQRIDALAAALHASSEAGQAVPHDLEKMLAGLIDKLERVQLTHTDHAALGHLEDRIAMLVKRFDASEARFAQLEAIERGLADLLVHVEQMRGPDRAAAATPPAWQAPAAPAFEETIAEIKHSEPRSYDSSATMQDTVEHVADRLAMIESNVYDSGATAPAATATFAKPPQVPQHAAAEPIVADEIVSLLAAAPAAPLEPATAIAPPASPPATRPPLDPTLPPDHPLEVGFTSSLSRPNASAAERIASSEAAIGSAKPPVIADAGRPNFIAAARRAAQAAAWEPSTAKARREPELNASDGRPSKLSQRLRKLIVAGSALLIVVGCARIAMRLLDDGRTISSAAPVQSQQSPAPAVAAPPPPAQKGPPANAPAAQAPALPLPNPPEAATPAPAPAPAPAKPVKPEQQSLQQGGGETVANAAPPAGAQPAANERPLWATPDITGTLPRSIAGPAKPRAAAPAFVASDDDLPAAIGDPALRAAAIGGDPAAAYEIAARFAEGRGVAKNSAAAAHWLERAVQQGLAPAQFRLGGLYEKGIGVKKDLARARDLYLAAAQKGNGKAMHNLAVIYAEGVDGAPDYTSAAEWFRRGADHGLSDSQYNLGILYARGIGVKQDYAESYKWFALAANQGDQDAAAKRDEVAGHLDAQALAAARSTVQNFKPEPQPDEAVNVKTAAAWQAPANVQAPAK